jgi:hypothetical protein
MSMPEVFPVISVDTAYGEVVDSLDVNLAKVVDYLKDGGFSNEEIGQLSIHFSAENMQSEDGLRVTQGNFIKDEQVINLFYLNQLVKNSKCGNPFWDYAENRLMSSTLIHELEHAVATKDEVQQEKNACYDRLVDEKRHSILGKSAVLSVLSCAGTAAMGAELYYSMAIENHPNIAIPYSVGVAALSLLAGDRAGKAFKKKKLTNEYLHEVYLNRPEEIRCRKAQEIEEAAADATNVSLVNMATKPPTEHTPEQQKCIDDFGVQDFAGIKMKFERGPSGYLQLTSQIG